MDPDIDFGTLVKHLIPQGERSWEPRSVTKHYMQVMTRPGCIRHAGTVPRRLEEEAMQIIETQELVPSCHRPEVVETSELQPTCHS